VLRSPMARLLMILGGVILFYLLGVAVRQHYGSCVDIRRVPDPSRFSKGRDFGFRQGSRLFHPACPDEGREPSRRAAVPSRIGAQRCTFAPQVLSKVDGLIYSEHVAR
jgi:hypothetical protein